jgi:N-acetylglucosamine-6-sulfatase
MPASRIMRVVLLFLTALVAAAAVAAPAPAASARPNIVMVMTDDQSTDLLEYMPNVQRMQREGVSFSKYVVTDSLCCPSRASILTGEFPHDTGVFNNTPPLGGWQAFADHANETKTYAFALQGAGYRTSYMGKYFNGYLPQSSGVPVGWSNWWGFGSGYKGFDYTVNVNGNVVHRGHKASDYATDVMARQGDAFIQRAAKAKTPFLLAISPFAPHYPYAAAPRHRNRFASLRAPRTKAWNAPTTNPPSWLGRRKALTGAQIADADRTFRRRARSVLAVDEMIGRLRRTLQRLGVARTTYVVFTSDNGLHNGQHRLTAGKMTAYDSDVRVPLVAVGPGVPAGRRVSALTANIDLAPTFMRLGGVAPPRRVDGRGLVSLLKGGRAGDWRDAVLVEHHGPTTPVGDPDEQSGMSGTPPRYWALRLSGATYVEYEDGDREYYDLTKDPAALHNVAGDLSAAKRASLHRTLTRLRGCHHTRSCWDAAQR